MTMHLAHPSLSLSGKRKGKTKFRTAEQARKARELAADWEALKSKYNVPVKEKRVGKVFEPLHTGGYKLSAPPGRTTTRHIPSLDTGGAHNTAPVHKVYTGTKVLGIATMHKSNAVPVFAQEEAVEISRMRRG